MSKEFRQKIEYNHLEELADQLQLTDNYKIFIKGISEGKSTIEISKELNVSRSRVDQMYWQYVSWCRRLTGLYYFTDFPPVDKKLYDQIPSRVRMHEDQFKEALLELQNKNNT